VTIRLESITAGTIAPGWIIVAKMSVTASMDVDKIVKAAKRYLEKPKSRAEQVTQPAQTVIQPLEDEPQSIPEPEPEQLEHLESLATPLREESVYGSGWSLAELIDEFRDR
jgi:hypothetical protein